MAQIALNIPDEHLPRVIEAMAATHGYDGVGTKAAFAKTALIKYLKGVVIGYEKDQAEIAARASLSAAPEIT